MEVAAHVANDMRAVGRLRRGRHELRTDDQPRDLQPPISLDPLVFSFDVGNDMSVPAERRRPDGKLAYQFQGDPDFRAPDNVEGRLEPNCRPRDIDAQILDAQPKLPQDHLSFAEHRPTANEVDLVMVFTLLDRTSGNEQANFGHVAGGHREVHVRVIEHHAERTAASISDLDIHSPRQHSEVPNLLSLFVRLSTFAASESRQIDDFMAFDDEIDGRLLEGDLRDVDLALQERSRLQADRDAIDRDQGLLVGSVHASALDVDAGREELELDGAESRLEAKVFTQDPGDLVPKPAVGVVGVGKNHHSPYEEGQDHRDDEQHAAGDSPKTLQRSPNSETRTCAPASRSPVSNLRALFSSSLKSERTF